jgi:hypothetical protein
MAHCVACWSLVTVTVFLVGHAAVAQTDNPAPAQPPISQPTVAGSTLQPVQWSAAAKFRMDCARDVQRLCHGVQPGEGRLIQCLLSNRGQLSPACMSRVAAARPAAGVAQPSYRSADLADAKADRQPSAGPPTGQAATRSAMRASCGSDVQRLCAGVPRENGGVIKCLNSHRMELSPTCDAFFKDMLARRAAQKSAPSNNIPPAPKTMPPAAASPAAAATPPAADTPAEAGAPAIPQ